MMGEIVMANDGKNITNSIKAVIGLGFTAGGIVVGAVHIVKQIKSNFIRDEDGFNKKGYDKEGYNREGYDKGGYDRSGYNKEGYDQEGYDKGGYNRSGYNKEGYDKEGYDKEGYNRSGYNKEGYDKEGYDRRGFNILGKDRSRNTIADFENNIVKANNHLNEAKKRINEKKYDYALLECRKGIELLITLLISHNLDLDYIDNDLCKNINVCKQNGLIDDEECEKLHQARKHCNDSIHGDEEKTQGQVYFVYKMLESLIDECRGSLI